jgi:phosphoribosyl-ATP pyrophosphohydrolase/phosphoribosyl-AMP cyclohydrolase
MTELDSATLDWEKSGGLVPAVVQHAHSGAVLMLGYMDRAALERTLASRRVTFLSRSKGRLWEKGETSGHTLDLVDVRQDCDRDTLLVRAVPRGPVCHLGTETCFGAATPKSGDALAFLTELEGVIEARLRERPEGSYTAKLAAEGTPRVAQKFGEEALELVLAGAGEDDERVVSEAADALFHLLVLLKQRGLGLERVATELRRRHRAG